MPPSPDDSVDVTPDQRRREVARILARGMLRSRSMQFGPGPAGVVPEPAESRLEASTPSRPHVTGS